MIKIYREAISSEADRIEAEFQEVLLGYEREIVTPEESARRFGVHHSLPVITNNDRVGSGDEIPGYVRELQNLMHGWQAFQGDWCYVNDKGENC
jgi:hypothetical protein